ncbi:MAG: phospho-sugar mutase [Bacteroidetes bacterium]|uniref:Phospho-sugar mutase n=1 Tax=Candidatus Cryptobacteroides intestinigallinarum TaxID=2840767 RepID=A0A9D9HL24_9BACT|nr:phospho-sugar mutase [Candidatus Cryptobacteroides intestinigallinarum]
MENNFRERAQSWLDGNFDQETKDEVRRLMETDPAGLEDAFYRNLEFGTGGLRGIMGVGTNRMNKYVVAMATQGLANYILKNVPGDSHSVCVSFDSRNNSAAFAKITAEVLSANGIHVFIYDCLHPVPLLSYAVRKKHATAGVMVTASHNPKEYNGYKVYWSDGAQIISPVDKEIVAEVNAISDPSMVKYKADGKEGGIETMGDEMNNAYMDDVLTLMLSPEARAKHKDLKIVYTPLHGSGVHIVPAILARLGFENIFHVPAQDVSDGNFPTVQSPNPEEHSALEMAVEVADKVGADLVLATDPDADRLGIAVRDNEGKMVLFNGNQTASMLTYYILRRWSELGKIDSTKYVVKTIVTTELIRAIAEKYGVKVYNVLTGFKYIADIVRRNEGKGEFICGGEESYGFNVGQFVRDKDAPISCAMVAECAAWAAEQGKTLYQLLQDIYAEFGYYKEGLVSLVRKGKEGVAEIAAIMTEMRNNPPKELAGVPVTKVIDYDKPEETGLPKSNVLQFFNAEGDVVSVRPSGTEPKIKFYFGARGADADAKIEKLRAQFIK